MLRARSSAGPREVLESVRALRRIPPEIRAKHERAETLEQKFIRWQRVRVPDLSLEQRPYDPAWAEWFAEERDRLAAALGPRVERIEHHGSTSVPGLASKNVVDIAVALDRPPVLARLEGDLAALRYQAYGNSPLDPETWWFWRIEPGRAFAVHVGERSRPWLTEVLDHRDYLRAFPEERERYARWKEKLAAESDQSLLQYTISKMTLWIEFAEKARAWRRAPAVPSPHERNPKP